MKRVSTVDLIRNFGPHSDSALAEPLIITKNGRDRLVLISIEQYNLFQHALDAYEDTQRELRPDAAKPARRSVSTRRLR